MTTENSATPPAASGVDVNKAIKDALAEALGPVAKALGDLAKVQGTQAEALTKLTAPPPVAAAGGDKGAGKALTQEDVSKMVAEGLKTFASAQNKSQARSDFARTKLGDLPETYRNLLPETDDAGELAKAEQSIRDRYKTELGDKLKPAGPVASGGGGGGAPKPQIDVSKLSPTQKIEWAITNGKVATQSAGLSQTPTAQ